jgi:hypothetical protein
MTLAAPGGDAMGLTLPAVLTLIGVVVAVLGIALAPLWRALRQGQKATKDAVDRCDEQLIVMNLAAQSQALGLRATSNTLEAAIGILHRVLEGRAGEVSSRSVVENLHAIKVGVERAVSEAVLLSATDLEQQAALQQLVHRLGDRDTMKLFAAAASRERLGSLTGADLARAAAELEARLNGGR